MHTHVKLNGYVDVPNWVHSMITSTGRCEGHITREIARLIVSQLPQSVCELHIPWCDESSIAYCLKDELAKQGRMIKLFQDRPDKDDDDIFEECLYDPMESNEFRAQILKRLSEQVSLHGTHVHGTIEEIKKFLRE